MLDAGYVALKHRLTRHPGSFFGFTGKEEFRASSVPQPCVITSD